MNKKTKQRRIISIFISYILSLCLVFTALVGVITFTSFNKAYLKSQIKSSDFSTNAKLEIDEYVTGYGLSSGFDPAILEDVITENMIKKDMFSVADAFFNTTIEAPTFSELEETFQNIFLEDLEKRDVTITSEIKKGIEELSETCKNAYVSHVNIPFSDYLSPILEQFKPIVNITFLISLALVAIVVFLNIKINSKINAMQYFAYSLIAAAGVSMFAPIIFGLNVNIKGLGLSPLSLKNLVVSYISGTVNSFWIVTLLFFAAALIVIFYIIKTVKQSAAEYNLKHATSDD